MASWNGTAVVDFPPRRSELHPAWVFFDCGCCGGLRWGTEQPSDCYDCHGTGYLAVHEPSGTVAVYPGGPLRGWKMKPEDVRALVASIQDGGGDGE